MILWSSKLNSGGTLFRAFISSSRFSTASILNYGKINIYDMNFDRRIKVDYKDSIKYMESEAYKETYQGHLVWKLYRRNHKGGIPSRRTRPSCVNEEGFLKTSYPCPICRDEYLVLHPENTKLLAQFIDPNTDQVRERIEHGLCLRQFRNLQIAAIQAHDRGTLPLRVVDRLYNYDEYRQ